MQPAVVFPCLLLALCHVLGHGVCTGRADTIYSLFDRRLNSQILKVNVPCSVNLYGPGSIDNCILNFITAHPEVRLGDNKTNDPAFRTFINSLDVKLFVTSIFSVFEATLNGSGIFQQGANQAASTTTITGNSPGTTLRLLDVASCADLTVGFRQLYGEAFISAPLPATNPPNGLCGNCNDNLTDEGPLETEGQRVAYFLAHITPAMRQRGPFVTQCSNIANAVTASTCTMVRRTLAGVVCGRLMGAFGRCLISTNVRTGDQVMTLFATCVASACGGAIDTALCAPLTAVQTAACPLGSCP
ncbi:hypothetical protein ACOMHN_063087 [Nucella lapillus]